MKPRMKVRWIVALIVVPVLVVMGAIACTVLHFMPVEARLEAATQQNPDPWKGLKTKKAWIILTFVSQEEGGRPELTGEFELVGPDLLKSRAVPLPIAGEKVRLLSHYSLRILEFGTKGEARVMDSPALYAKSEPGDETGIILPIGTEVLVEQVHAASLAGSPMKIVWALVSPPSR